MTKQIMQSDTNIHSKTIKRHYLDFEQPIAELNNKLLELYATQADSQIDISKEIEKLENKLNKTIKDIYAKLNTWQIVQLARHLQRPRTLDYIHNLFTDFTELHGDRHFADDKSIIGGLAKFAGQSVMVIGHQKGKDTKENLERNFGMPRPEGYRKALRLMQLAEKFSLPIFTFVDTNGAYPGIGAEERNQSEAIGKNLYEMTKLKTPIITTVIGEGGSGGALAIAVADQVNMLQYAIYSVITPEGCASILWKNANKASIAADILGLNANKLYELGLIDAIINEPLGGAQANPDQMMQILKKQLELNLKTITAMPLDTLLATRLKKLLQYGEFSETPSLETTKSAANKKHNSNMEAGGNPPE